MSRCACRALTAAPLSAPRARIVRPVVARPASAQVIAAIAGVALAAGVARMRLLPYHCMGEGKYADLGRPAPMALAGAPPAVSPGCMASLRAAATAAGMVLVE